MGLFSIFLLNGHGSQAEPDLFLLLEEEWWAHKGSNLGPLPCEGNALPLSYAPGIFRARSEAAKLSQIGKSTSSDAAIYEGRAISVKLAAMIAARRHAPKSYFVEPDQGDLGRQSP